MDAEIIEKDLSSKIMKAAFEVHNLLGPGFSEKIYEEAMALQLQDDGMELERQKRIKVFYKKRLIGKNILDLVVNRRIILELKAITAITPLHDQQTLSRLKATGLQLAFVINFGAERVQYSRIVNTKGKPHRSTAHNQAHKPKQL